VARFGAAPGVLDGLGGSCAGPARMRPHQQLMTRPALGAGGSRVAAACSKQQQGQGPVWLRSSCTRNVTGAKLFALHRKGVGAASAAEYQLLRHFLLRQIDEILSATVHR
jgi:hypothetical protein